MAQSSWPFENIDTNETQFSQWARNIGEGVKTGALNELEVFADSTGMQVKVRSGQALVRGHYYQNTAELALSLEAADLTNPRVDTVVLELDPSANSIVLKVITGTPDPSPTAEPVVQTDAGIYQIKLANVAVATGATTITAGNVTDTRFYIEDFSGNVPGSSITGEITTATMDGDRLFNAIDSATIPAANVTGLQTELDNKQNDVITTQGDLVRGDGSGNAERLGIGANGTVLTSDGTQASWEEISAGGMTLIDSGQISNQTLSITNIPQTYNKLVLEFYDVSFKNINLRVNNFTSSEYRFIGLAYNTGSVIGTGQAGSDANIMTAASDGQAYAIFDGYTNPSKIIFRSFTNMVQDTSVQPGARFWGVNTTGPITSIQTSNTTSVKYRLWGVS